MRDNMTATPEQKNELIVEAMGIAGFTEDTEYPGLYAQVNGNIKTVVDLTAGVSAYLYDREKKQKLVNDDAGTLKKLLDMITEAEDGQMPSRTEPDIIVTTTMQGAQPDDAQTKAKPEQIATNEPGRQLLRKYQHQSDMLFEKQARLETELKTCIADIDALQPEMARISADVESMVDLDLEPFKCNEDENVGVHIEADKEEST